MFKFKKHLKPSARQERGLFGIVLLIALLALYKSLWNDEVVIYKSNTVFTEVLDSTSSLKEVKKKSLEIQRYTFSEIPVEVLKQSGLVSWKVTNFEKYRNAGGRLYLLNDFLKIYGAEKKDLEKLRPYIIEDAPSKKRKPKRESYSKPLTFKKESRSKEFIYLNAADTTSLKQIKGIGSKLSSRILKYRDALGGFYSNTQLFEVWGLDSTLITNNLDVFIITDSEIEKLNINTAQKEGLVSHPYISWRQAEVIINYRNNHGEFQSLEELLNTKVFSQNEFDKLRPYLIIVE